MAKGEKLIKIPNYSRMIEFIGDSLSQGYGASYEGLSSKGPLKVCIHH